VATALGAHPGSAAVQSTGSFAVSTLCDGGESGAVNRGRLLGAGAREAVVAAVCSAQLPRRGDGAEGWL
jgi:hypothetical protein